MAGMGREREGKRQEVTEGGREVLDEEGWDGDGDMEGIEGEEGVGGYNRREGGISEEGCDGDGDVEGMMEGEDEGKEQEVKAGKEVLMKRDGVGKGYGWRYGMGRLIR